MNLIGTVRSKWAKHFGSTSAHVARDYFMLLCADATTVSPVQLVTDDPGRPGLYLKMKALGDLLSESFGKREDVPLAKVFEFEVLVTRLVSNDRIRAKAWSVRSNYLSLVGKDLSERYMASAPPDARDPKVSIIEIRADLEDLLAGLHWWYANTSMRERALSRIKERLLEAVVLGLLPIILLMVSVVLRGGPFIESLNALSILVFVMYAGLIGAVTSTIRRMQPVAADPVASSDPLLKSIALDEGSYGIYLSAFLGSVFAVVLYLVWAGMGDLVGGKFIPILGHATPDNPTCRDQLLPCSSGEFAKVMIWSFLAGFTERLVPDMLDRLSSTTSK